MSKIGAYLQEHISGEVSLSRDIRESVSRDGSILKVKPEMVVYPKDTNDIRKVARFSWQLAERGHILPITARGGGGDQTGSAIGSGIVLSLAAHMNHIYEYEPKQRLVRLQPGASVSTFSSTVGLLGIRVPALPDSSLRGTVGGAIANNSRSLLSGRYGAMNEWVDKLEVVLANGDVIQTGRISKRELSRKKGLGTLEGEIYRSIDNLIEDNKELVAGLSQRALGTNAGYARIAFVKQKDGSFDLTPLIVGSQGTLGIISEMILKTDIAPRGLGVVVASFSDAEKAREMADMIIAKERPAFLESYDSELFEQATLMGRKYGFLQDAGFDVKSVLLIGFDDAGGRKHLKKVTKLLQAAGAWFVVGENAEAEQLLSLRNALIWATSPDKVEFGTPPVFGGSYVPPEAVSVFRAGLKTIAKKHELALPVHSQDLQSIYYIYPKLNLKKSGDKQKMLRLLDDYAKLIQKVKGELVGVDGEGRLMGRLALESFDDDTNKLFASVKEAFDPFKILNPGVKEVVEIKQLVPMIQSDHPLPLPGHVPSI